MALTDEEYLRHDGLGLAALVRRGEVSPAELLEVALLLKTRLALFARVEERIRALHSHACPCIVAWPIVAGSPDYLAWIAAETRAPGAMA